MAIREELTLGIQTFQANLDRARADVRRTAGEMSRDMRNSGGRGGAGGAEGGGILGGMVGSARFLAPAAAGIAAFRIGVDAISTSMERARAEMALGAVSTEDVGTQLERLRDLGESPGLGFDQAVAASTKLQAVGISAALAEKAIAEMGNALALVGGGKEQLEGIMTALTQIVSKGTVSAEEINQIAERLPQIRVLMKDAFGTADTEAIQKLGIGTEEFIAGIVDAAGGLERATETASSAMSNLQDDWKDFMQTVGDTSEPFLKNAFTGLSSLLEFASDKYKKVIGSIFVDVNEYLGIEDVVRIEKDKEAKKKASQEAARKEDEKFNAEADKQEDAVLKQREKDAEKAQADVLRKLKADADQRARDKAEFEQISFDRSSPEEQAQTLRDRLAKSLGVDAVGSAASIEAAIQHKAAFGDEAGAVSALKDLAQLEAIAGRMPGQEVGMDGAVGQGGFATLMDQIFGRGTPEQQLEEIRKSTVAVVDSKVILDKILGKMDDPPPKDTFTDSDFP